jgi:succinate dehydrogenase / fumarate reductase cytochrome b subunit
MAEVERTVERPLSPHLGIYRVQVNMAASIMHRITGGALYFGTILLAAWLVSAAMGARPFALVNDLFGHPLGRLVLLGYSWALIHHMLGGIRHLIWDTGRAMHPRTADTLAWLTIVGALVLTAAAWYVGLSLRGAL